ncbi:MAG: hypothetical protein GY711_23595 [bacterium]|nr:hypothetical protein [bacterium]
MRAPLVRAAFAVALLAAAGCSGESVEVEVGYRGEARANPLLAAERFSTAMGLRAESDSAYSGPPATGTVLVAPAQAVAFAFEELAAWVEVGGHLILLVSGVEQGWGVDATSADGMQALERSGSWLDWLGVEESLAGEPSEQFFVDSRSRSFEFDADFTLDDVGGESVEPMAGDPSAAMMLSYVRGTGRVTLLASGSCFTNERIDEVDHAALLWQLLSLRTESSGALFVYGLQPSLVDLILRHLWTLVLAGGVLLGLWLWHVIPRFGPLRADAPLARRDFSEHVVAVGRFLWRERSPGPLLDATRRRVQGHIEAAAPELATLEHGELAGELAARTSLSAEHCYDALFHPAAPDAAAFTRYVRDLRRIDQSL